MAGNREKVRFAICANNDDYPASLKLCKVHRVILDPTVAYEKVSGMALAPVPRALLDA
jgi:hypothetical protein